MEAYSLVIAFNLISFWAALLAVNFWLKIYSRAKHGSIAWLLFAVCAVFMTSVALFPYMVFYFTPIALSQKYALSSSLMIFWSAVYTAFFAGAGFVLYRHFVSVPKEALGRYLVEGLVTVKKEDSPSAPQAAFLPENAVSQQMRGSTLITYSSRERYEDAVIELTLRYWGELHNVILVSSPPRAAFYESRLRDLLDIGVMKLVVLCESKSEISHAKGVVEIPIGSLDYLSKVFADLPQGCAVIFELTRLAQLIGQKKASEIVRQTSRALLPECDFIALLNYSALEKIKENFESSFTRGARLTDDAIELQSAGAEPIPLVVGERFYIGSSQL